MEISKYSGQNFAVSKPPFVIYGQTISPGYRSVVSFTPSANSCRRIPHDLPNVEFRSKSWEDYCFTYLLVSFYEAVVVFQVNTTDVS